MGIGLNDCINPGGKVRVVGKLYTDDVNSYILTHNFKTEDRQQLYTYYLQYGENTQIAIATLAIAGISEIIANDLEIDDSLLSILLQATAVTRDQKIILFAKAIPILNEDSCMTHFDELELSDLKGIFAKGCSRRNYEKNDDVTAILDALKMYGWINEYRVDERNNDRYIVIKNKPRSKEHEIVLRFAILKFSSHGWPKIAFSVDQLPIRSFQCHSIVGNIFLCAVLLE